MKIWTQSLLAMIFCILSARANAYPVVLIQKIEGRAFQYEKDGSTKILKAGDSLEDFSELLTEEGSQVTLVDQHDHRIHLSGSSHVSFLKQLLDLKRGYAWIQTIKGSEPFNIQTANSRVEMKNGEAIVSFDQQMGKTQVLSIEGTIVLENSHFPGNFVALSDGHFSYVQKEYDNGLPRKPTQIGFDSFKKVTAFFKGIEPQHGREHLWRKDESAKPIMSGEAAGRLPASASVNTQPLTASVDGESGIVLRKYKKSVTSQWNPDQVHEQVLTSHQFKKPVVKKSPYSKASGVSVKVFKSGTVKNQAKVSAHSGKSAVRAPASINSSQAVRLNPQIEVKNNGSFENSLIDQYKHQMRHETEVNRLIEDLRNYDQDYQIGY